MAVADMTKACNARVQHYNCNSVGIAMSTTLLHQPLTREKSTETSSAKAKIPRMLRRSLNLEGPFTILFSEAFMQHGCCSKSSAQQATNRRNATRHAEANAKKQKHWISNRHYVAYANVWAALNTTMRQHIYIYIYTCRNNCIVPVQIKQVPVQRTTTRKRASWIPWTHYNVVRTSLRTYKFPIPQH